MYLNHNHPDRISYCKSVGTCKFKKILRKENKHSFIRSPFSLFISWCYLFRVGVDNWWSRVPMLFLSITLHSSNFYRKRIPIIQHFINPLTHILFVFPWPNRKSETSDRESSRSHRRGAGGSGQALDRSVIKKKLTVFLVCFLNSAGFHLLCYKIPTLLNNHGE